MARPISISRGDILAAAQREFARQGYGETSLRRLMAAAGVSTTAFYARYPSKEAVLAALVEEMMTELYREGARVLATAATLEVGIESGVDFLVAVLRRHRAVVALALTEGSACESVREPLGRALRALAGLLAARIASAAPSRPAPAAAEAHGWALVGALHIQVMRWAVFGQLGDDDLAAELMSVARSTLLSEKREASA